MGTRPIRTVPPLLAFLAVIVTALNLRAGPASVGPVLTDVITHFEAPAITAGLITSMPGVFFALMGFGAVPIARRLGLSRTLLIGGVLTFGGLLLRPFVPNIWLFLLLTALVIAGIALGNVLLPAWVKKHGGSHTVTLVTLNSALASASAAIGPLSALLFDGPGSWKPTLLFWAGFAAIQVVVWVVVSARVGYDYPRQQNAATGGAGSLWRSKTAVALMAFFGLQSMHGYVQMGYLPQMFMDSGVSQSTASIGIALVGAMGIVGGLVLPKLLDKASSMTPYVVIMGLLGITGYLGVAFLPASVPLVWSILLGLGGWAFPLSIALIVASTREASVTARLSGFVQPVGYAFGAAGPLLIGAVSSPEDPSWTPIILFLAATLVVQAWCGVLASRRSFVDDELAAQ